MTWKPIFRELSLKLLDHEQRQDELCALLRGLVDQGLPAGNFTDKLKDGTRPSLSVIDPFTFFGAFNRQQTNANRIAILKGMCEHFGLEAQLPSDFDILSRLARIKRPAAKHASRAAPSTRR